MPVRNPDLDFKPGDHVCAFYSGGQSQRDDIVVDFISPGLLAGDKCICFIDGPESVAARVAQLSSSDHTLEFFTEAEGYLPTGSFSADVFIEGLDAAARAVFSAGFERLRIIGDAGVVVRDSVDLNAWFAAEARVSELAPRYPQSIMCLYDLDLYGGDAVMYVLKTHTRIYINGLVINNPYYIPQQEFLGELS